MLLGFLEKFLYSLHYLVVSKKLGAPFQSGRIVEVEFYASANLKQEFIRR